MFAVVATLIAPAAGHVVLGRWRRGVVWLIALLVPVFLFLLLPPYPPALLGIGIALAALRIGVVIDAAFLRADAARLPSWKWAFLAWALLIVGNMAIQPAVKALAPIRAYTIPAQSMMETLLVGDYVLVDLTAYRRTSPKRGDVVVLAYPGDESRDFIMRVVAIGGDTIQVRDHRVWLNAQPLAEPYVRPGSTGDAPSSVCRYVFGCEPLVVPAESYFVMGDNRDNSQDSRYWGFVRREKIRGRAFVIYFSWDRRQHGPRWPRIGARVV